MGDTRAVPIQNNGNGNGNGNAKARDLALWVLGLAIPALLAMLAALYSMTSAHGERIKGCEVQASSMAEDLRDMRTDIKEILRRLEK